MFEKIVLASNNTGKLHEFRQLFQSHQITVVPQSNYGVDECSEPYFTFVENALAKARHASHFSGLPALADDSGICVSVLNGAPGVFSARYAGEPKSDSNNNAKLAQDLSGYTDKTCYYVCVLVLIRQPDDPQPLIAQGVWRGLWQDTPIGEGGFGYDPHFYVPEYACTAAQLSLEQKNTVSHRAQALRQLLQQVTLFSDKL